MLAVGAGIVERSSSGTTRFMSLPSRARRRRRGHPSTAAGGAPGPGGAWVSRRARARITPADPDLPSRALSAAMRMSPASASPYRPHRSAVDRRDDDVAWRAANGSGPVARVEHRPDLVLGQVAPPLELDEIAARAERASTPVRIAIAPATGRRSPSRGPAVVGRGRGMLRAIDDDEASSSCRTRRRRHARTLPTLGRKRAELQKERRTRRGPPFGRPPTYTSFG